MEEERHDRRRMKTPHAAVQLEGQETAAGVEILGEQKGKQLVTGPLRPTILRLAGPAVASMLLMTLFASVDAFWIGRSIGPAGLAAVVSSVFWVWMLISVAEMIGVGLTAIAARRHGEGRHAEASRVAAEALVYGVALGAVLGAIGGVLAPSLFRMLGASTEVTQLGVPYLRIYMIGAPLIFGFFAVDAAFRSSGDTRTPLMLLAGSVMVTMALDPILILGLWIAPELGMQGAAISMVGTRAIVCVVGVLILIRRGLLTFGPIRMQTVGRITQIGLPLAAWGVTFSLIYVWLARIATPFGTSALAAIGIGHRVESWLSMTSVGFGAAAAAIVGQNIGAGRIDRAEKAGWMSAGYTVIFGVILSVISLAFAEHLAALFTSDPVVIAEGARYLRITVISNLFLGSEVVLEASMGGAGSTLPPMLTSTALTAARIPLAIWLSARIGIAGIWWAIALTAAMRGIAMMALWKAGYWKHRSV